MEVLRRSDEPTKDRSDFLKANILFWLMGATDGHAKNFRLAMHLGKSNNYKVGDIVGRHILETGLQAGLSREAIASVFEDIRQSASAALDKTFSALPDGFPTVLAEAISDAFEERLEHLS